MVIESLHHVLGGNRGVVHVAARDDGAAHQGEIARTLGFGGIVRVRRTLSALPGMTPPAR